MLIITELSKNFGQKKILNRVSLTVAPSEIAILLGSSGVGKSTLLRILSGLDTADGGTITLDNNQHVQELAKKDIGMVFQNFNLFEHMTVLENITFPLIKVAKLTASEAVKTAKNLLSTYQLADKGDEFPGALSGGQKQRLALARALALKPQVICLDEPTSALDPLLKNFVAETINNLAQQDYIILVASHDIGLIDKLNGTIYLMDAGTIIETITTKAYRNNPEAAPAIARFIQGAV